MYIAFLTKIYSKQRPWPYFETIRIDYIEVHPQPQGCKNFLRLDVSVRHYVTAAKHRQTGTVIIQDHKTPKNVSYIMEKKGNTYNIFCGFPRRWSLVYAHIGTNSVKTDIVFFQNCTLCSEQWKSYFDSFTSLKNNVCSDNTITKEITK